MNSGNSELIINTVHTVCPGNARNKKVVAEKKTQKQNKAKKQNTTKHNTTQTKNKTKVPKKDRHEAEMRENVMEGYYFCDLTRLSGISGNFNDGNLTGPIAEQNRIIANYPHPKEVVGAF